MTKYPFRVLIVRRTIYQRIDPPLEAIRGVLAGVIYAARKKIAAVAAVIYRGGRRLLGRAIITLANMMPSFVFGGA